MRLNSLIDKVKAVIFRLSHSRDDVFYHDLFVKSENWSGAQPNLDESNRWEAISSLIENFIPKKNNLNILDLGSGRGWLSNLLLKYGKVTGIEPVALVVKHARKLFPNIQFYAGYLDTFIKTNTDKIFDLIVSSEVIEHVPTSKKKEFVGDLKKILTPGGHIVITTPRREVLSELKFSLDQPIEDWLTEDELSDLFLNSGFHYVAKSRITMEFNSKVLEIYQVWLFRL